MMSKLLIQEGLLNQLSTHLSPLLETCSSLFFVIDQTLPPSYGEKLRQQLDLLPYPYTLYAMPAGEENKTLLQVEACWKAMMDAGIDRHSRLIAMGGGVLTDLAGWVAASYMRGIPSIYLPTTLMGMVDASVGGKTGINFSGIKNVVGAFHLPQAVLIDPLFLATLSDRELRSGLAEVIKYGVIEGKELFESVQKWIPGVLSRDQQVCCQVIKRSCEVKSAVVEEDRLDKGRRAILNFGHTFAHAIEAAGGYNSRYLHGEAVAMGMSASARLSVALGYASPSLIKKIDQACHLAGLSTELPRIEEEQWVSLILKDKKSKAGKIACILAEDLGKVFPSVISEQAVIMKALYQT